MKGDENVHHLSIPDSEMEQAKPIINQFKHMPSYGD